MISNGQYQCEFCRQYTVKKSMEGQIFNLIHRGQIKDVNVVVPVYTCSECELSYTDEEAEKIREQATTQEATNEVNSR
jgi:propanediol utilization protein